MWPERRVSVPTHLVNAARTLEEILSELYPDRQWIVSVREDNPLNRDVSVNGDGRNSGSVADHSHAVGDRPDPAAAAGPLDEDTLDEAA